MQLNFREFHSGNAQGADFEAFLDFSVAMEGGYPNKDLILMNMRTGGRFLVSFLGNKPTGFIHFRVDPKKKLLMTSATDVEKNLRHQGIATQLGQRLRAMYPAYLLERRSQAANMVELAAKEMRLPRFIVLEVGGAKIKAPLERIQIERNAAGVADVRYRRLRPHEILHRLRAQGLTARQLAATQARLREKFASWKRRPNRHSPTPK